MAGETLESNEHQAGSSLSRREFLKLSGWGLGVLLFPDLFKPFTPEDEGLSCANPEAKSNLQLLTDKVEAYFKVHPREYVIKEGNQVWRNGKLHSRLKLSGTPRLVPNYTNKEWLEYEGARYLGNAFAIGWRDPDFGAVDLYGFEVAVHNPKTKEWAAVPILWATSAPREKWIQTRVGNGTHSDVGPYEKILGMLKFGKPLEVTLESGDNTRLYSELEPKCSASGHCNYDPIVLARAFGPNMYPKNLIQWIKGETTTAPSEPVLSNSITIGQ
jgi:hypothetical protein